MSGTEQTALLHFGGWSRWTVVAVFAVAAAAPVSAGTLDFDVVALRAYLRSEANGGVEVTVPAPGEAVYFHVEWSVTGSGGRRPVLVRALLDGVAFCSGSYDALPGTTVTMWCNDPWPAATGAHSLLWQLDVLDQLAEPNEANNTVATQWTTGLATATRTPPPLATATRTVPPLATATRAPEASATATHTNTAAATPTAQSLVVPPCAGDCDGNREVRVAELITAVNAALGRRTVDACAAADANGDARVAINELLLAVNHALRGCPKLDIVLQIVPGAVLLDRNQSTAALRLRALDRRGKDFPLTGLGIEWLSSDGDVVDVVPEPSDRTAATVQALVPIGTAMVTARLASDRTLVAPLVAVTRAAIHPDAVLVPDRDVVFPPPDLPDGVPIDPREIPDYLPADAGGEAWIGGFLDSELAARLEVTDTYAVRYPVVLRGNAPPLGQRMIASGGAAVAGIVVATEQRGRFAMAQLEVAPPQDLFETLDVAISAEELLDDGLLPPFDASGWDEPLSDAAGTGDEARLAQLEVPIGSFVCKPVGLGIVPTFTQAPVGANSYFGPIWDGTISVESRTLQYFYFKAGLQARTLFNPEIRLTQGVRVEATCDLRDDLRVNRKLPVNGPLAVLLAPYVEGLVSIPFKVALSGGATSRYGAKLGFDYAWWTGGTYTPETGWQALCETWDDCSRTKHEAELIWDDDRSSSQMTIEGETGLLLAGDAGIQAGGIVFDVIGLIPGLGRVLSGAAKALEEKGKVPVLRARLGPHGVVRWHNPSRTAFIEASEAAANLVMLGDLAVRLDALNSYLQTALRLGGVRSIPLLSFPLFHFGEPFRVLEEETLTVNGRRISDATPVEVRQGDAVSVRSTVERSFVNLTLIELFVTSFSAHEDFPYRGEVWANGRSIGELATVNPFTLSGTFSATRAICDQAEADGGSVEIDVLAFNSMFSVIPTANYAGSFRLRCTAPENEAPVVDAGGDQDIDLAESAVLNGTVTDDGEPDPPGALTLAWNTVSGPGSVVFTAPAAADTQASFSEQGRYVLQLSASDGALTGRDTVAVTVHEAMATPERHPTPVDRPTRTPSPTRTPLPGWTKQGIVDSQVNDTGPGALSIGDGSAHYTRDLGTLGDWDVRFSWQVPARILAGVETSFAIDAQLVSWDAFFGQIRAGFDVEDVPPGPLDVSDVHDLGGGAQVHDGDAVFTIPANAPDELDLTIHVTDGGSTSGYVTYRYLRDN